MMVVSRLLWKFRAPHTPTPPTRPAAAKDLLRLCEEKFSSVEFSDAHFLRGLVYFTDADAEPTPRMLQPLEWEEVKRFFEREARAALS